MTQPQPTRPPRASTEKIVLATMVPEAPEVLRRAGEQIAQNRSLGDRAQGWFGAWLRPRGSEG